MVQRAGALKGTSTEVLFAHSGRSWVAQMPSRPISCVAQETRFVLRGNLASGRGYNVFCWKERTGIPAQSDTYGLPLELNNELFTSLTRHAAAERILHKHCRGTDEALFLVRVTGQPRPDARRQEYIATQSRLSRRGSLPVCSGRILSDGSEVRRGQA